MFQCCLPGRARALPPVPALCRAQLHRTLVHSLGTAPREAGTQPGLSYIGIWDAGSWWAATCTKVERSNLDIQDPAGSSLPCPSGKKSSRSLCGKSSITCRDSQDGHWKKDLGHTAATKDEKRGHVQCSSVPDRNRVEVKSFLMTFNKQLKHEYGS